MKNTYLFFLRLHIFLPLIVTTLYPTGHFLAPGGNSIMSNSSIKGSTCGIIDFSNTVANEVEDSFGKGGGDSFSKGGGDSFGKGGGDSSGSGGT